MDTWLTEWEIPYQVAAIDHSAIVVRFQTERFARAFAEAFGLERH